MPKPEPFSLLMPPGQQSTLLPKKPPTENEVPSRAGTLMAIVDDYAGIAAELRRMRAEKAPEKEKPVVVPREPASQHRMRATITGELLYRRLIANSRRAARRDATDGWAQSLRTDRGGPTTRR